MKTLTELFDDFLDNPDEGTIKGLCEACDDYMAYTDQLIAQFGLTDMVGRVERKPSNTN